jgi:hypothetical protein
MTFRRRGYLVEARYKRDKKIRDIAEGFYKDLVRWLKGHSDELKGDGEGNFIVKTKEFWKHSLARNLSVGFVPSRQGVGGGLGKIGGRDIILLAVLIAPGDKKFLDTRVVKDVVIHEMVHYLDPGLVKGGKVIFPRTRSGEVDYFNHPSEWNAFWQEGAWAAEKILKNLQTMGTPEVRAKAKADMYGTSLSAFRGKAGKFWDKRFLKMMSKKLRESSISGWLSCGLL